MHEESALDASIRRHDAAAGECGVWLGAEPTFTDRTSELPEWLSEALGSDKEKRARALLLRLAAATPGSLMMRTLGRQYPNEERPRWCYGLYVRRDGKPQWGGPADKLSDGEPTPATRQQLAQLAGALERSLQSQGWFAAAVPSETVHERRLVCRPDGKTIPTEPREEPRLARPSVHEGFVEDGVLVDTLGGEHSYLLILRAGAGGEKNDAWIELPGFAEVAHFAAFLEALEPACAQAAVGGLGLRGFTPPVDDTIAWTTLTPDPAVVEINQAPQPNLASFHRESQKLFQLAEEIGLSPYRLHYNGEAADSGGGGQLTFGGPAVERSPFFVTPKLLPRLIRYLIRHPSLSYWFATPYVGGSSQSPRPDEGVRESFVELEVALEQLSRVKTPSPEVLWGSLRHFLTDASGNPHRSELNIEKLFNPYLPGRGKLGLVEFRALGMARSLDRSTARAMLLRSIVLMLQRENRVPELTHWGETLHDRYALPYYLRRDLREVFMDLESAGFGLGADVEAMLLDRNHKRLAHIPLSQDITLDVEQGIEFWPLVGDVASQEGGGSRLVDASTTRLEVRLSSSRPDALGDTEICVNGFDLQMREEPEGNARHRVMGVRYRSFVPLFGLHPAMPAEASIEISVRGPFRQGTTHLSLHPWRPDGGSYPGLPEHRDEAEQRRHARAVVVHRPAQTPPTPRTPPAAALTPFCLDLRRVSTNA